MDKLWEEYIEEKEIKIHPKRKSSMSFLAVAPIDDVLAAGATIKTLKNKNISRMKKAKTIGMLGAGLAAYGVYRYIRSLYDKCTKTCGTYELNTPKRQLCLLNCKKLSLQKRIELMKKNKESSDNINKYIEKLKVTNQKIILYKKYIREKELEKKRKKDEARKHK